MGIKFPCGTPSGYRRECRVVYELGPHLAIPILFNGKTRGKPLHIATTYTSYHWFLLGHPVLGQRPEPKCVKGFSVLLSRTINIATA